MIDKTCYNFVERGDSEFYSIRILKGEWLGVIYTYGRVSIKENKRRGSATLSFDYKIEDTSESDHFKNDLENSPKFKNYIGDILASVLSESEGQIGNYDRQKSSNSNHTESHSQ